MSEAGDDRLVSDALDQLEAGAYEDIPVSTEGFTGRIKTIS